MLYSLLKIGGALAHPLFVGDIGEPQTRLKAILVFLRQSELYFGVKWPLRSLAS